ncbi:MAX dimerization protein MGA a isoform X2 [Kryptolebias marmoratus]|uniref:MAX dimerization protein MGA a isoform X2 n=1 Tax=Kryptolebias marmoratus TaxID=37003 RepID=UPI0007F918CF|nr:MAX dimerization protein MGA a isoform X2 [Kryptolebias marmoratus]
MASTKTRHSMVFLKDGTTVPTASAADPPPARLAALRPEKVNRSGTVQSTRVFGDEAGLEHNMYAVKEAFTRTGENRPAGLNTDSVSPDSVCKGVRVTLDNNSMWNECFRCRTEMILTKQGSRMFPYCRFRISGLQQCRKYVLVMDIQPLDSSQYRWTGDSWQVSRKAECQIKTKPFIHPESPATGQHWMQGPVSFYKLKLTNNTSDQEGNIILHPLHRYLPRLHLVETDKAVKDIRLNGPNVLTFAFPQTEFMTVTTYQNPQFAQLKVNYNPFAKGLKEDGSNLSGLKLKTNSGRELNKDGGNAVAEQHPVKKSLKFLLANHKPRCSKAGDPKPSAPKELQRSSDYSAAVVPGESPSNSRPAQKLISQLICEAHVSLQRSSSEQRSTNLSSPVRAAQNNTKTPTNRDDTAAPAPTVQTSREMKDDDRLSDPQTPPDVVRRSSCDAAPSAEQTASSDSAKQQKRPARLPLPALALFLKQHSAKHKRSNSKLSSPPPESSGPGPGPEDSGEAARQPSSPANRVAASDSQAAKSESLSSELEVFHDEPDMYNSETPKVCPSTCSTSPERPRLSPPLSTVLSAPNSPKTSQAVEDTAVEDTAVEDTPVGTSSMKTESLLFDPECSSLGFEPMSPASSPEPLPPLPASLAFEIDPASSVAAGAAESAQAPELASPSSVFTWHTVLPPPDTYVDSTFTAFQPPPQASPLKSVTPPLLPCLDASAPPDESAEPSLPFPAELSPLALHLSLSPTFSSLDENGLSPAPSLSELVHFFSTDVDIGIGGEFSNPEATPAPSPPPPPEETQAPPPQAQPAPARKPGRRKRSKSTKLARLDMNQNMEDYRSLQPNLEEVEEQLFVSFASKEALRLHVPDSCEEAPPPDGQPTAAEPKNHVSAQSLEEIISGFQKILLKDLEVMKYRQVIHPVLQEVGLKMTLLDPALSIDLQYLGVHLPIPAPGVGVEPLTPSLSSPEVPGSSAAFLSRTGKTTDVTQIKGWKEKFTPSETASGSVSKPEAGPSSEPQKKNLSAFCSDMLDEYLENEAKLIDERAASFSQPPVEPPVYKLPVSSTSYVRTLDHVLKKQTAGPPASDLISGFIPPSKRPRFKEAKTCRRSEKRLKGPKLSKPRPASGAPESSSGAALSETTPPLSPPTFKRRRKLKPTASSQTLGPPRLLAPLPDVFQGLAPVESDSELAPTASPKEESSKKEGRPRTTRALLRQKDLEDCVALEGRFRTSITEERAAIALTSLFTQTGFVSENPTAPIQLKSRRRFPCLNEFCRLGCVCSSLSHSSRSSHCGRPACMFGCSCLKQKVVLLKNLDSSDSSPTPPHGKGRKKRRRRMKMAYVLKEADSVSRPAERVQTLWRKNAGASDPELVFIPNMASVSAPAVSRNNRSSCARVRGFRGKMQKQKVKKPVKDTGLVTRRAAGLKGLKQREPTLKETNASTSNPPAADDVQQLPPKPPESPPPESTPKPSKRLFIKADCKWASDADRSSTVKKLCEAMAREQLTKPFWIKQYLIVPIDETVEGSGANQCIQYRVQITTPKLQRAKGPVPGKPASQRSQKAQQRQSRQPTLVPGEMEPPLEKAQPLEEVSENPEPLQVKKEAGKKLEAVEDWQKEIEGSDTEEERDSRSGRRAEVKQERSSEEIKPQKKNVGMATPRLKGATPAGFISAHRKQKGGTDHLVQVNGESLHPEPRLVGFLTGQVGSQPPGSGLTPHTVSASPSVRPTATCLRPDSEPPAPPPAPPPPKDSQVMLIPVQSSAGQRMVLQQIPSASGAPYYRRPDGKLVQLIPINHLRPVELKAAAPTDLSSSSSSSSPSLTPAVKKPSLTTLIVPSSSSSSSSSLSPAVFSPVPLSSSSSSVPVHPQPVFVADQSPCSMEVLSSSRDPVFVSLPSAQVVTAPPGLPQPPDPPPTAPIDLSSRGQRTEREVKAASAGPEDVVVQHKTASPVTPPPAETLPPPPESPEQELARDPMDLDIISVYDEAELVVAERRPVDVVELTSSSDTENSSDFRESDSDDEKPLLPDSTRHIHNMNERRRRVQLQRRFSSLRKEMGHTEDKLSKVSTLTKAAKLIRELRCTEDALRRKKRRLRKRRDKYLSLLDPSAAAHLTEAAAADEVVEVVEVIDVSDDIIEVSSDEEKLTKSDRTAETDGAETFEVRRRSCEEEEEEEGMTRLKESRGCGAVQRTEKDEMETRSAIMNIPTSPRKPPLDQEIKAPLREMEKLKSFESSLNHEKDEEGSWKASGREKLLTKQELKVEETLQEANQPPAGGGAPVAPPTGDTQDYITPSHPQWTTQAPPPCAVGLSISVLAHPTVSHNAPGTTKQPKTVPNILSRSKNPPRPPSLSASEGAPSSQEPLVPAKVLSLVGETLPMNPFLTVSPVIVGATFLRADPPPAPVSSSLPLFAQTGSPLPPLPPHLHQMQPSFSHPGPGGPPLLLLSRNQDSSQTLRPAAFGPGQRSDSHPGERPPGPDPRRDPDSESLSTLLDEIVFLNQKTVASATAPEKLLCEDPGGAGEQARPPDSVDPRLIDLTETDAEGEQPGPDSVNTNCGVLAPPPLLHMKMGGAKVGGLSRSDGAAADGVGSVRGGGGGGWRPMPRLVPLGVRGNSPS